MTVERTDGTPHNKLSHLAGIAADAVAEHDPEVRVVVLVTVPNSDGTTDGGSCCRNYDSLHEAIDHLVQHGIALNEAAGMEQ